MKNNNFLLSNGVVKKNLFFPPKIFVLSCKLKICSSYHKILNSCSSET